MKNLIIFFFLIVLIGLPASLKAGEDAESRARALYHDLRCMVCGGQSLAESNAELAVGMRQMILERLENGENEEQIKTYLTEKYGDEILMEPPVREDTWFIWLLPFLLLLGSAAVMFGLRRRRHG